MNRKGGGVDRIVALHYFAFVVYQHEVGHADLSEVNAERVDPEPLRIPRVAGRDVSGHSLVVSEARKQAKCGGQAFLAVAPLFGDGTENWRLRNILGSTWGFRHWGISSFTGRIIFAQHPWAMIYRPRRQGQFVRSLHIPGGQRDRLCVLIAKEEYRCCFVPRPYFVCFRPFQERSHPTCLSNGWASHASC